MRGLWYDRSDKFRNGNRALNAPRSHNIYDKRFIAAESSPCYPLSITYVKKAFADGQLSAQSKGYKETG